MKLTIKEIINSFEEHKSIDIEKIYSSSELEAIKKEKEILEEECHRIQVFLKRDIGRLIERKQEYYEEVEQRRLERRRIEENNRKNALVVEYLKERKTEPNEKIISALELSEKEKELSKSQIYDILDKKYLYHSSIEVREFNSSFVAPNKQIAEDRWKSSVLKGVDIFEEDVDTILNGLLISKECFIRILIDTCERFEYNDSATICPIYYANDIYVEDAIKNYLKWEFVIPAQVSKSKDNKAHENFAKELFRLRQNGSLEMEIVEFQKKFYREQNVIN